jgi:hypothetical protein
MKASKFSDAQTCAMHFLHDQLATGRNIRIPTVVDTFSRLLGA